MKDYFQEFVEINGIKQYFLHYPAKGKPVILFLHGGPGMSEAAFGYKLKEMFKDTCTLVFYDQRGTGRTLQNNLKAHPTLNFLLKDLHDTIKHLQTRYLTKKVIILGHSWGTVLGSIYALQHPENVSLYIGVGQVGDMRLTEKLSFLALKSKAMSQNSSKDLKKLQAITNYPPKQWDSKSYRIYNKLSKLKDKYGLSMSVKVPLVKIVRKSPIQFRNRDFIAMLKGTKLSESLMLDVLNSFQIETYGIEYKMPVYYIFGSDDYITPKQAFSDYFEKIIAPTKKIVLIENAGHYTMFEQPEAFAKAVIPFLNECGLV